MPQRRHSKVIRRALPRHAAAARLRAIGFDVDPDSSGTGVDRVVSNTQSPTLSCPVALPHKSESTVGHGGGARLTQDLIERIFRPAWGHSDGDAEHDGVGLAAGGARLAFTTDAHVVSLLFFPGGDIGKLAVTGTVNDLCMCGARPEWLSASFIFEERFSTATLQRGYRRPNYDAGLFVVTAVRALASQIAAPAEKLSPAIKTASPACTSPNGAQLAFGSSGILSLPNQTFPTSRFNNS